MLRHLYVRNLAVLAEASVELDAGLHVVTGETGAGKSLVVDSLALLAGSRASSDMIRTAADVLTVSGVFRPAGGSWRASLEEAGVQIDGDELVIRREVSRSGRNRVFVNDQPVTLRLLQSIAPTLLRIHGQGEELGLLDTELQRAWLDAQGKEQGVELLEACGLAYDAYRELADRLERLTGDDRLRQERIDLLRFQRGEIERAQVEAGEERALRAEREALRHGETITRALGEGVTLLVDDDGAALERLARARSALHEIEAWEGDAEAWQEELQEIEVRLDDLCRTLRQRLDGLEADPERLNVIEDRLSILERLLRKYGSTTEEILGHFEQIGAELEELEMDSSQREELEARVEEALEVYRRAALQLSAARSGWAASLVEAVESELADLGLKEAKLGVRLERAPSDSSPLLLDGQGIVFSRHGVDRVVFDFAPNPGEEPRPLARIASGGELSRVYLALQVVARGDGEAAGVTLVFDEVDAGVGGVEAAMVGRKLKRLARGGQILAVTHLPQVAACGDLHFRLEKRVRDERTEVAVQRLEEDQRVAEVARMLGGEELTDLSLSHAEELLAGSHEQAVEEEQSLRRGREGGGR